jgi:hypothetical protein
MEQSRNDRALHFNRLSKNDILPAADSAAALGYAQALQVVG